MTEKILNHLQVSDKASDDIKSVAQFRSDFLSDLAEKGYFFKPEIFLFVRSGRAKIKRLQFFEKVEKWSVYNEAELSNQLYWHLKFPIKVY